MGRVANRDIPNAILAGIGLSGNRSQILDASGNFTAVVDSTGALKTTASLAASALSIQDPVVAAQKAGVSVDSGLQVHLLNASGGFNAIVDSDGALKTTATLSGGSEVTMFDGVSGTSLKATVLDTPTAAPAATDNPILVQSQDLDIRDLSDSQDQIGVVQTGVVGVSGAVNILDASGTFSAVVDSTGALKTTATVNAGSEMTLFDGVSGTSLKATILDTPTAVPAATDNPILIQSQDLDIRDLIDSQDQVSVVQTGVIGISGSTKLLDASGTFSAVVDSTGALKTTATVSSGSEFTLFDGVSGTGLKATILDTPTTIPAATDNPILVQSEDLDVRDLTSASDSVEVKQTTGTNLHAVLDANTGVDIGDVDITSIIPGSGATELGKAEDDAHSSGDVGVMALGVRTDTIAALAADGDYHPLLTSDMGALWTEHVPNEIDAGNSTTSALNADAVFTGTGVDILTYDIVTITLDSSHDSATDGMTFQFSTDNSNWDDIYIFTYTAADGARRFQFPLTAQFFRVVYTNGGTNQTHFRVQTILHHNNSLTSIHRIADDVSPDRSAQIMKTAIIAQQGGGGPGAGDFIPVQATAGGNLRVSIEEFDAGVLGQDTMANSLPVTIASDQSDLSVSGNQLQVYVASGANVDVTATDLDIRDLADGQDQVSVVQTGIVGISGNVVPVNAGTVGVSGNQLQVYIASGTGVDVTATDLDIRDLTSSQDSIVSNKGTLNYTPIHKRAQSSNATTAVAIWTPGTGSKFVLTDITVSVDTAGTIDILDSGTAIITAYLAANGGFVSNFQSPIKGIAVNRRLEMQHSDAGSIAVVATGYEEL